MTATHDQRRKQARRKLIDSIVTLIYMGFFLGCVWNKADLHYTIFWGVWFLSASLDRNGKP